MEGSILRVDWPSCICLGELWANDMLGAYLFGSLWLNVSVYVYRWGKHRFFVEQPLAAEAPAPVSPTRAADR